MYVATYETSSQIIWNALLHKVYHRLMFYFSYNGIAFSFILTSHYARQHTLKRSVIHYCYSAMNSANNRRKPINTCFKILTLYYEVAILEHLPMSCIILPSYTDVVPSTISGWHIRSSARSPKELIKRSRNNSFSGSLTEAGLWLQSVCIWKTLDTWILSPREWAPPA